MDGGAAGIAGPQFVEEFVEPFQGGGVGDHLAYVAQLHLQRLVTVQVADVREVLRQANQQFTVKTHVVGALRQVVHGQLVDRGLLGGRALLSEMLSSSQGHSRNFLCAGRRCVDRLGLT